MRALLHALDLWVREGVEPPDSEFPSIADGTLVNVDQKSVGFPVIPIDTVLKNVIDPPSFRRWLAGIQHPERRIGFDLWSADDAASSYEFLLFGVRLPSVD